MKRNNFLHRKKRIRAKIKGTTLCPRLSIFRSNKFLSVQIINDEKGETLLAFSTQKKEFASLKKNQVEKAAILGEFIAKKALAQKIKKVVFDKSGYKYHGVVKALAEGCRKGGLKC